jgi:sugar phosphate isomerase/epimerase
MTSSMPAIVFGLNTSYAVKRWPEPDEWSRIAASSGVSAAQFSFDLLDPMLANEERIFTETRTACEANGITITSTFTGLVSYAQNVLGHPDALMRRRAQEWYAAAIDATAWLGARGVGGHMGAMSVRQFADPSERSRAVERVVDSVRLLAERAAARQLDFLLWEVMPVAREFPADLESTEQLMSELEGTTAVPVELCLDLGHACLAGASGEERDPYQWLERLGRFTRVVHLQQTDGAADRHWPFTAEHNVQGIVDPERVVDLVRAFDRDTVELMIEAMFAFEAPDEQVLADVRESVAFWAPALARLDEPVRTVDPGKD